MHAGAIELKLELDGRSWSVEQKFNKSEHHTCHHMDQRAHQSKKTDILEAQSHAKAEGTHQEASWPKAVASGGTHWSAGHICRPTGGPSHRPPILASGFQEASLKALLTLYLNKYKHYSLSI